MVEHCELTYAPSGLSLIVTARCHGATETAEITLTDASAADSIIVGDAFELVPAGALRDVPAGIWYYDAAHSYEAQLEGLRIAEPLLVSGALVIVDDTDWDDVARAMDDYLEEQARARRILTLDGKSRGAPQWWEGMQVLVWDG